MPSHVHANYALYWPRRSTPQRLAKYLVLLVSAVASAQRVLPFTVVRALDFDPSSGYRESHESACTRIGLLPTPHLAPLAVNNTAALRWGLDAAIAMVTQLGDANLASPAVTGCCAGSMYCTAPSSPLAPYVCGIHGTGDYSYSNAGWTANNSLIPVFSCASGTVNATTVVAGLPVATSIIAVPNMFGTAQLRVDGRNFGSDESTLQVYVGGAACSSVVICQTQCMPCSSRGVCGNAETCIAGIAAAPVCLRTCDTTVHGVLSCPCGGVCYEVLTNDGATLSLCFNGNANPANASSFCAAPTGFSPLPSTGSTDRLECTPTWPRTAAVAAPVSPFPPGPGPLRVPLIPGPAAGGGGPVNVTWGGRTVAGGYPYGGVCAASAHAIAPVIVVRDGWASSGLGASLAASAGLPPTLPAPTTAGPFASLPYYYYARNAMNATGGVVAWTSPDAACTSNSDCSAVDLCSLPQCLLASGAPATPANPGCCVYAPTSRCASANAAVPASGYRLYSAQYMLLPREAAGVMPLPPPPLGGAGLSSPPAATNTLADMAVTQPSVNPTAHSWSPSSAWYGPAPAVFPSQYDMSDVSQESTTPALQQIPMNVGPVLFFGGTVRTLYVSPYGYLTQATSPICGTQLTTNSCSLRGAYAGIISPLTAAFSPGSYYDSEVYTAQWDTSALSGTNGSASARVLCAMWINMGLDAVPLSTRPDPSFTTALCVHGDGGLRWRYGAVLGVAGYDVGVDGPTVPVSPYGGPPNGSAWIAGVRSLSMQLDPGGPLSTAPLAAVPQRLVPASRMDVALETPQQFVFSRQGVKQGATGAACHFSPLACASPSCGTNGTVVLLQWAPLGCGLGFEALGVPGPADAMAVPRIECVFGAMPVVAALMSVSSVAGTATLSCIAPAASLVAAAAGAGAYPAGVNGSFTVPLRLQLILPGSTSGYNTSTTAPVVVPGGAAAAASAPSMGVGVAAAAVSVATQTVTVPMDVVGVEATPMCFANGSDCSILRGGAPRVEVGMVPVSVQYLVPHVLAFRYLDPSDAAVGATCGCADDGEDAACDACGVCGGASDFRDCAGVCFGAATIDACGNCTGGTTGLLPNAFMDCTGMCGGHDTSCAVSPTKSPSPQPDDGVLTVVVIVMLVTCSIALMVMAAYFGYLALVRQWTADFAADDISLDELGIPPGLSPESMVAIPIVPYSPAAVVAARQRRRRASTAPGTPALHAQISTPAGGRPDVQGRISQTQHVEIELGTTGKSAGGASVTSTPLLTSSAASSAQSGSDGHSGLPAQPAQDTDGDAPDACSVCMEPYVAGDRVRILPPCAHVFHAACVDTWLARSTHCPECRAELRSAEDIAAIARATEELRQRRRLPPSNPRRPAAPTARLNAVPAAAIARQSGGPPSNDPNAGDGDDILTAAAIAAVAASPAAVTATPLADRPRAVRPRVPGPPRASGPPGLFGSRAPPPRRLARSRAAPLEASASNAVALPEEGGGSDVTPREAAAEHVSSNAVGAHNGSSAVDVLDAAHSNGDSSVDGVVAVTDSAGPLPDTPGIIGSVSVRSPVMAAPASRERDNVRVLSGLTPLATSPAGSYASSIRENLEFVDNPLRSRGRGSAEE